MKTIHGIHSTIEAENPGKTWLVWPHTETYDTAPKKLAALRRLHSLIGGQIIGDMILRVWRKP